MYALPIPVHLQTDFKAVLYGKLKGAQCAEPVKPRVSSI